MILSIIIPAYNAAKYLERCFASIYNTAPSKELFEVIVINDGSKDNTLSILQGFREDYNNLTVIDQPNRGVSVARNKGIAVAKGDYVLFLDADDEIVDGALDKVISYLAEHEPMDMLITKKCRKNIEREWFSGKIPLEEHRRYNGVEAYKNQYVRINAGGGICRTRYIREHNLFFPEGVKNAEDTVFFGHFQVFAQSIVYYNILLYRIIMTEDSASRNHDYTKLGKNHAVTMRAVSKVKESLKCSREQKGIFDFVVYQLLSNTIGYYVASEQLSYYQFKQDVDLHSLLPLDTQNMYKMKKNAKLMNFNLPLFYFLSWLKFRLAKH